MPDIQTLSDPMIDIQSFALAITECKTNQELQVLFSQFETSGDDRLELLINKFVSPITQKNRFHAERAALHLVAVAPDDMNIKQRVINWYAESKNLDKRRYQAVLDTLGNPNNVGTANRLGKMLRKARMPFEACLCFRRALSIEPTDADALRNLAAILRDEKHYDAGLMCMNHLLKHDPQDAWAHVQKGNLLARMSAHEASIEAYRQALILKPMLPEIRTALARQYSLANAHAQAIATLIEALHDDPTDQRALEGLADAYRTTGQHANAMIWYQRALKGRANSRSLKKALSASYFINEFWEDGRLAATTSQNNRPAIEWTPDQAPVHLSMTDNELDVGSLIGLGLARELAMVGVSVTCVMPEWACALVQDAPETLHLLSKEPVGYLADAIAPDELIKYCGLPDRAFAPWLSLPRSPANLRQRSFAFITGSPDTSPWPDMNRVREVLAPDITQQIVPAQARKTFGRTYNLLKRMDFVITDDSLTAIVAASIGCPSIVFVPSDCEWWWANRSQASPYCEVQTVIRIPPDVDARSLMTLVKATLERSGKPKTPQPRLKLAEQYPVLHKELFRIAKHFTGQEDKPLSVVPLAGGTRNAVFKLGDKTNPRVYRLSRFPAPRKHFYHKEMVNMKIAAEAGLAPRIDFTDALDGSMLIDFIDGETMRSRTLRKKQNAVSVAQIFRKLHCLPGFKDKFDIYKKVKRNIDFLSRAKSPEFLKAEIFNESISGVMDILAGHRVPHYATHNDPLTRNFVLQGDRMMLIDWECSGIGDPHWDVAAMSAQAGLDKDVWHAYLAAYFGSDHHPAACRIPLLEAVCRYYWWTEALYSGAKNPDDPSWKADAERWSGWLGEIVESNGFKAAVKTARNYQWDPTHSPAAISDQ